MISIATPLVPGTQPFVGSSIKGDLAGPRVGSTDDLGKAPQQKIVFRDTYPTDQVVRQKEENKAI